MEVVGLLPVHGFCLDQDTRVEKASGVGREPIFLCPLQFRAGECRVLQARARVNEAMDWLNTNFYRTFGYGLCYTQLLDAYKLPDETGQRLLVEAGKSGAERNLRILNDHMLQSGSNLCGEAITIADYFASGLISLGEAIGCTFTAYPNVVRWYDRMKSRPNWEAANAGLYVWADFARGPTYVNV